MAYTPSPTRAKTSTNFSGLISDGNRNALTGALGNAFQTRDNTPTTPVGSPLAMSGAVQTLVTPNNATQITINPTTAVVQVSEDSTMSVYFTVPVGASQTFPCARQQDIYLKGTSPDVVNFYYDVV